MALDCSAGQVIEGGGGDGEKVFFFFQGRARLEKGAGCHLSW